MGAMKTNEMMHFRACGLLLPSWIAREWSCCSGPESVADALDSTQFGSGTENGSLGLTGGVPWFGFRIGCATADSLRE
jgi:hypothetical protein